MWNGKKKAITFSFDDGVEQDKRLIELFDKYNLKCTFNLNSGLFGAKSQVTFPDGIKVQHNKINPSEIKEVYKNHEVAAHTISHPLLTQMDKDGIIYQVEQDRKTLSAFCDYEVFGMAYPCGGVNNDDRVAEIIKSNTPIKYVRTITSTHNFDLQTNLHRFNPTVHTAEFDKLTELCNEFLSLNTEEPKLFYIWGHSYEFDYFQNWDKLEEIFKMISGKDDIFYGTNSEVLLTTDN